MCAEPECPTCDNSTASRSRGGGRNGVHGWPASLVRARDRQGSIWGSRVARAHRWPRLTSRQVTDSGLVGTASAATIVKLWPSTHSVCERAAPASAPRLARLPETQTQIRGTAGVAADCLSACGEPAAAGGVPGSAARRCGGARLVGERADVDDAQTVRLARLHSHILPRAPCAAATPRVTRRARPPRRPLRPRAPPARVLLLMAAAGLARELDKCLAWGARAAACTLEHVISAVCPGSRQTARASASMQHAAAARAAPLFEGEAHGCAAERPGGTHCAAGAQLMGCALPYAPSAQSAAMPRLFSSTLCGRSTQTQPPLALVCLAGSKGLRRARAALSRMRAPVSQPSTSLPAALPYGCGAGVALLRRGHALASPRAGQWPARARHGTEQAMHEPLAGQALSRQGCGVGRAAPAAEAADQRRRALTPRPAQHAPLAAARARREAHPRCRRGLLEP